jgi:hypothetical protein
MKARDGSRAKTLTRTLLNSDSVPDGTTSASLVNWESARKKLGWGKTGLSWWLELEVTYPQSGVAVLFTKAGSWRR